MPMMRIAEYRDTFTPASRPDPRTVIAWIEAGELYAERRGRCWYVDPDRPAQVSQETPEPTAEPDRPRAKADDNDLVRQVLGGN